jgi:hypothetical protein
MSAEERDPLLDKLHALPLHQLDQKRSSQTLRAVEAELSPSVRRSFRWPEFALGCVLSVTGLMYAVDSVHKLGHIYGSDEVASLER